jgi:hypothetical protein
VVEVEIELVHFLTHLEALRLGNEAVVGFIELPVAIETESPCSFTSHT